MTKIVNEPKFNQLSNLHFSEIDRKFDNKVLEYNQKVEEKLKTVDQWLIKILQN